ncbi:unnamed protein product [Bemisia tabaci]|uniref:DUF4806 domain-containing protein n=1 Tax=Bemisia tabaci TaxID=7038 RepID=A0A9P0EX52_BEMTA|nr:unnamed protein product [Bemisia tabaci]
MKQFVLVKFTGQEGGGDIVPLHWMDKTEKKVWWPPKSYSNQKVTDLIKKGQPKERNWISYSVHLLSNQRYNSFTKAEKAFLAKQAEFLKAATDTEDDSLILRRHSEAKRQEPQTLSSPFVGNSKLGNQEEEDKNNDDKDQDDTVNSNHDNEDQDDIVDSNDDNAEDEESDVEEIPQDNESEENPNDGDSKENPNDGDPKENDHQAKGSEIIDRLERIENMMHKHLVGDFFYDYEIIDNMLPLDNDKKLTEFEKKCISNPEFKEKAIKWVCCMGGKDEGKIVTRSLKQILTPEVASLFSYEGRKLKRSFQVLQLDSILKTAAKRRLRAQYDEDLLENAIVNFLKHAPDLKLEDPDEKAEEPKKKKRRIQRKMPFYFTDGYSESIISVAQTSKDTNKPATTVHTTSTAQTTATEKTSAQPQEPTEEKTS